MSPSALFDLIDNAGASTWLTAGAATLATIAAYKALSGPANVDVIKSPFSTQLPHLSSTELNGLPYPPDVLPGARDVESPYGTIRVFEWGPERGRKVLLVHGISTPCLSLAGVAVKLVERGCRVMLFDLFGRGYSDAPQNLKHDAGLYTTQILLCLASSHLSWTGTNAFSLIGYSLGGGISAAFTSYLPHLVESLILIAPSGLIRQEHIGWSSRILYQTEGILPEAFIHWLVRRRLMAGPIVAAKKKADNKDLSPSDALAAETGGSIPSPTEERGPHQPRPRSASTSGDGSAPIFAHKPQVTVPASVQWQILNHEGFISAFTSAIRHAPITRCHPLWRKIGTRLTQQKVNSADQRTQNHGLWRSKVLLILGRDDPIIIKDEIEQDATEALGGKHNVEIVVIAAGHELPVNKSRDVTDAILRYWGEEIDDTVTVEVEEDLGT